MADDRIIVRVVEMFYIHGINQEEIAKRFNFSKAKVCRIIKEAKEKKIIEFKIKDFGNQKVGFESELEKKFNLKEVLIYYDSDMIGYDKDLISQKIGILGANYIKRILKNNINMALTWGETLYNIIKNIYLKREYKANFFAALGGVGLRNANYQSSNLVKMIGERTGGSYYQLYLPLIVDSPDIKNVLMRSSIIKTVLGDITKVDYYITSVATILRNRTMYTLGGFKSEDLKVLHHNEIIGEIGLNFYNKEGNYVKTGLEDRLINIKIDEIKRIKNIVLIAFSNEKLEAISGFLKSGVTNVFITDSITAEQLLII